MSFTDFDFPHTNFYNSDLRELLHFYKTLQEEYAGLVADIKALNDWRTEHEGQYDELLTRVGILENEISSFESTINAEFDALEIKINEDFTNLSEGIREQLQRTITELRAELERTITEINTQFNELKLQDESEIAAMKLDINDLAYQLGEEIADFRIEMDEYLDERFNLFIANLPDYEQLIIYNPFRGEQTTIQIAINDIYSYSAFWSITAKQFDDLGLTCEEFEAFSLTCTEFDRDAYKLLGYPDPDTHMRDPFTGEINLIKNVVMELYGLHAQGLTAGEFDALDLTAEEFDAKEVTAFEFDFFGSEAA